MEIKDNARIYLKTVQELKTYAWSWDWMYAYLFTPGEQRQAKGVEFFVCIYDNEEDYKKRMWGERVDSKYFLSLYFKQKWEWDGWYSGLLRDDENKKARWVSLNDNKFKRPWSDADKTLTFKPAEYRERQPKPETHPDWEWEGIL